MLQIGLEALHETPFIPFTPVAYPINLITPLLWSLEVLVFSDGHVGNLGWDGVFHHHE